eukprot:5048127-Prorocentrum_lima.AAC.1
MTSSLVGSEMCIRDRFVGLELHPVSLIPTDKAMNSLFDRCRDVEGFSMNLVETATSAFSTTTSGPAPGTQSA